LKNIITIVFLLVPLIASSQRAVVRNLPEHDYRAMHFGFTLGLNTMDFRIRASRFAAANDLYAEVSTLTPGFNINVVSNFRMGNYFDLRILPGVSFGQRKIDYYTMDGLPLPGNVSHDGSAGPLLLTSQELESSFLELPVILKYKSVRINNYRPYLLGGINFRYDLARNFNEDDGIYLDLNPFDTYLETGFGIDFYLPYFKFSTELKYAMGVFEALDRRESSRPQYQNAIKRMRSNLIILSFHFE
jgi:hypothetical protein